MVIDFPSTVKRLEVMKISIILNEREYAETALDMCVLDRKPTDTLTRVAKYYADKGYKKNEIRSLLESFMLRCDPGINLVKWQDIIDSLIKSAMKSSLVEIESIPITKEEIKICDELSGVQMRRLMFTLICIAKYGNMANPLNKNWVNKPDKEIFYMANVKTGLKRQSLMLNDLRELGLIRFSRKVDNININVTCLSNGGKPELKITDFRNLGYQYLRYHGEPYIECEECGLVIKKTTNNQKYCVDCGTEANRQKALNNWYKHLPC